MATDTTFTPQVLGETEKALNAILYRELDGRRSHRAPVDRASADRDRRRGAAARSSWWGDWPAR